MAALAGIAGLLLYYSQTVAFTWDEGFHLLAAQLVTSGKRLYLDFCFPQPPLNTWFLALCLKVFRHSWRTAHAAEALLTWGAVVLLAGYVAQRFPEPSKRFGPAALAAVLFGCNSQVVEFGTVGQAYGLCLFFLVAAFRLATMAAREPGWPRAAAAGALAGAAAESSLLTLAAMPVFFAWLVWHSEPGERWKRAATFAAGAALPFVPVVWLFAVSPGRTWFNLAGFQLLYRHATWQGPASNDLDVFTAWLASTPAALLGLLAAAGLVWTRRSPRWDERRRSEIALCGWLALAIGGELCFGHPTFVRYYLLVVPFLAIPAVAGVVELSERLGQMRAAGRLALLVSVLAVFGLGRALHDRGDVYRWSDLEAVAAQVERITPPGAAFWSHEHIYFLTRRAPPEGIEFSYARTLALPDEMAARLHIARESDLARRVRRGEFGSVALCDESDLIDRLALRELYRQTSEDGGWQFFWDPKAAVQAMERTTPPSTRKDAPLTADASGLATNATMAATSSGVAKR